ncbi:hypothetical protein MMC13_001586 [Lambiella insularis]|nr:hypothetical protein [Lambiella insularis]
MDVWSGSISIEDQDSVINLEDVHLHISQPLSNLHVWANVKLKFHSFVDPTAVPLHLVAGPSLSVFTSNVSTEEWFNHQFLDDHLANDERNANGIPGWKYTGGQSDLGILLQVDGNIKTAPHGPLITELLLYAALPTKSKPLDPGILTPPRSSSPAIDQNRSNRSEDSPAETIQLYALPLISELDPDLVTAVRLASPPLQNDLHESARFLSCSLVDGSLIQNGQRKRRRLDSLFEDATHQVKRSKKRGGETIAKAMASISKEPSRRQETTSTFPEIDSHVSSATLVTTSVKSKHPRNFGLSRAHSLGSLRDLAEIRPPSRSSAVPVRRSTLNRVTSSSCFEGNPPTTEESNGVEQRNKSTLSRIVMAGMRMYGLQQRKKPNRSRAASELLLSDGSILDAGGPLPDCKDEYKLVYHQTYKAASFVFRRHIAITTLGQGVMRDVVDRFLEMFCVDPVSTTQDLQTTQHGFGDGPNMEHSPFDSASALPGDEIPSTCIVTPGNVLCKKFNDI